MSKYLCRVTEEYHVTTESEVDELIEEARESNIYDLKKSGVQKKEVKEKGEVVDEFYVVVLCKHIQDLKNPEVQVDLHYEV